MQSGSLKAYLMAASAAFVFCTPFSAQAAEKNWKDKIDLDARLTFQYITDDNTDLDTGIEKDDSFSEQLQVSSGINFTDDLYGFAHVRGLNISGGTGFEDDNDRTISSGGDMAFLELRELYLLKKNLMGELPLSLQVGRQRIKEPRALWWNSDNDLVKLSYNTTLLNSFLAAGENLYSYRNNTDSDFREEDKDRFHVLGETSWQYKYNHFLEGRFMYENDHSGLENPGTIVSANNRDNEDADLLWLGVRGAGQFENPSTYVSNVKYRADLIGVAGSEDELTTAAGPGASHRTVTGSTSRDVRAWAFDGGFTVDPMGKGGPVLFGGYATGSGDDDPTNGTDHEFRQTDLQGSSSRVGLERSQQKNYGEVLRPELSNIHILNAGVGIPLSDYTDIGVSYYYYRLAENATSLRSSGITAPLNGHDKYLGQAVDVSLNVDLDDQFKVKSSFVKNANFRVTAGSFFAGDAYGNADGENAFRVFSELNFNF